MKQLLVCATFLTLLQFGTGLRCYECRSDEVPNCGDPFNIVGTTAIECDNFFTQTTFMCFKAQHFAAGQYIVTRGCAPFNVENFPRALQFGMAGTYWKNGNSFSLCNNDICNSSQTAQISGILALVTVLRMFL